MFKITEEPRKDEFLQSRIDQQVELICILKQRADEYLLKYQEAEKQVHHLQKDLEESQKHNASAKNKCGLLQKNISQLEQHQLSLQHECNSLKNENLLLDAKFKNLGQHLKASEEECVTLKVILKN